MKPFATLLTLLCVVLLSCNKDDKEPPPDTAKQLSLKEVVIKSLPAPYYRFVYNGTGQVQQLHVASGMAQYTAVYEDGLLKELRNEAGNKDKLLYTYDEAKMVMLVRIMNENGTVDRRAFIEYDAQKRPSVIEWERKGQVVGFAFERTLRFTYHADGNLAELRNEQYATDWGQAAALYIDRFEQYDANSNADDFALLHLPNEHLLWLPGVRLQKNNPKQNIHSGDGDNYTINYTYTYNNSGYPVQKAGDMLITSGQQQGQHIFLQTNYGYYE